MSSWLAISPASPGSRRRVIENQYDARPFDSSLIVSPYLGSWFPQPALRFPQRRSQLPNDLGWYSLIVDSGGVVSVEEDEIRGVLLCFPVLSGKLSLNQNSGVPVEEDILAIDSDNEVEWLDAEFESDGSDITDANVVTATALIRDASGILVPGSSVTAAYDSANRLWRAVFPYTISYVENTPYYPEMTMIVTKDSDGVTPRLARGKRRLLRYARYAQ